MEKKILILCTLFAGVLFAVFSCQQMESRSYAPDEFQVEALSVEDARAYFEGFVTEFELVPLTTHSSRSTLSDETIVTPMWKKAREFLLDGIPTIEVPYNHRFGIKRKLGDDTFLDNPNKRINTTYSLVIQTLPDGEITLYSLAITCKDRFLQKRKNHISKVSLQAVSSFDDFSADLRFYSMSGEYRGGYAYRDGNYKGPILRMDGGCDDLPGQKPMTRVVYCQPHILIIEDCWYTQIMDGERVVGETKHCTYTETEWIESWEEPDPPTGGGGSNGSATKAKKIFRNDNLSPEEWDKIENMIEQIINDCMGGPLYNSLVDFMGGSTLSIEFDPSFEGGKWLPSQGKIILGDMNGTAESHVLFHELFHVYQASESASLMNQSMINYEAEAFIAQYKFRQKIPNPIHNGMIVIPTCHC